MKNKITGISTTEELEDISSTQCQNQSDNKPPNNTD